MVPTPRAVALQAPLRDALERLQLALSVGVPFDPCTSRRRFRILTSDVVAPWLLPALQPAWPRGPSLSLGPLSLGELVDDLQLGRADLALGPPVDRSGLRCEGLSEVAFAVALREGHPCADALDLQAYARLDHVLVQPLADDDRSVVDRALSALGLERRVVLRVPSFLSAPWALIASDLALTAPRSFLDAVATRLPIRIVPAPLALPPFQLALVWHARWGADPGHRWLRGRIRDALGPVPPGASVDL